MDKDKIITMKTSSKKRLAIIAGFIAIAVAATVATLSVTKSLSNEEPIIAPKTEIDIKVIEENVRAIAELATLTYEYSDVGVFSEQKSFILFGKKIGIIGTNKSFIITYDGVMKFGIEMAQITITPIGSVLTVELPPVQLLSHTIKEDTIKLLDEKSGVFTSFDVTDYANFMAEQKEKMEARALERNLYEQAKTNAEMQIKVFFYQYQI